ncbi:STAS domain-containing protein [Amantichitinum ursilacus]|uniref:Putative anti-sigma factor antagonist n=1 Tax=Amantichitinum ursilacus TaxID=857265 RepID=A0A0N0GN69_9NEIS|nr:STAS domain-containing protein [Amantichitinum ursilacus]KPC52302.1 putative anti-sigma factor antagonist [Amantichitinum ursilacus]
MNVIARNAANGATVFMIKGPFTQDAYREFRTQTSSFLADHSPSRIVVDFSEADYVDSAGLGMLLSLRDRAAGVPITLQAANPAISKVFEIANLKKLFHIN